MADKKNQNITTKKLLDNLDAQSQGLFKSVYHSTNINDKMFNQVSDELNDSIQKAIRGDENYSDISNTTALYSKLLSKSGTGNNNIFGDISQNGDSNESSIMDIFQDNQILASLMDTYSNTKWIKVLDEEIDMCLKYMPKLKTALNIKKDTVLCADSFSKKFLNASFENAVNMDDNNQGITNIRNVIRDYNLEERAEQWYDQGSTYGEALVYIIPYKKAFKTLLSRKSSTTTSVRESVIFENGALTENYKLDGFKDLKINKTSINEDKNGSIKLYLNRTCLLENAINNTSDYRKQIKRTICQSIYNEMILEAKTGEYKKVQLQKSIDDQLEYEDPIATDGLVGAKKESNINIKVPGCIVKTLERENTIPLYIEDMCVGYYYLQTNTETVGDTNNSSVSNGYNSITSMFMDSVNKSRLDDGDRILKHISGKIAENINATFINSNQNLKKEIYTMLKYNDKYNRISTSLDVTVTFIPPEDIVHIKFNEDPITHRGRSDLWDGLIAAKMWIMLNSTSVIGNVTRGQDKRVYYVKTMVETNVAKTLLNVVSQIKKGNFGLRQMESINNILNVVGKFNDLVIPVGPTGDSPVTFDIMQGQQFDLPMDLMNGLEESAVSSSGVPLEIVNSSSNIDFAIKYTMTNGRLLRDTLATQSLYSKYLSKIVTKIYNCEYEDSESIVVTLPPPTFLVITQGSQLIQNTTQYIDALAEVYMANKSDEEKIIFKQEMLSQYLPSYIDLDLINKVLHNVKLKMNIKSSEDNALGIGEEV